MESIIGSNLPIGSMSASGRSTKSIESAPSPDAMPGEVSTAPSLTFSALPVKYDQQDYLSMLALQHHQQGNLQGLGFGLYSSGVNLDFASSGGGGGNNGAMAHCYANSGSASHEQYQQHEQQQDQQQQDHQSQSSNSCSSIPFATPIAFSGSPYESSVTPSTFGYYPNVAAFHQTPIYGME